MIQDRYQSISLHIYQEDKRLGDATRGDQREASIIWMKEKLHFVWTIGFRILLP